MIFVVLGTQKFQLNRLLKEIDELIEKGGITQEVIAQVGVSDYEPKHFKAYRFLDKKQFDELIGQATVVISHSGVGSIITALKAKKPIIVYPRLQKYHEHVDNHQLDIAKAFEKKNYIVCCHEEETLSQTMERCRHYPFAEYVSNTNKIIDIIQGFFDKDNTTDEKRVIDEYVHQDIK
jgi:UDP-N-acetylglucosamine transferase subunit ALG13